MKTSVNLGGNEIPLSIKRSRKARSLRLQVSLEYGVEAIAPNILPESEIFKFISKRQGWVLKKLKEFEKYARVDKAEDELFYLGQVYKVNILNGTKDDVFFDGECFQVTAKRNAKAHIRRLLEAWYRREARINITYLVHELSKEYDLEINRITIREQKTRWGSASRNKNLNFNFWLMMAPEEVIKYVVIHELTHLTEMNHSKEFWRLVSERCRDYQKHIRWLKRHGPLLKL